MIVDPYVSATIRHFDDDASQTPIAIPISCSNRNLSFIQLPNGILTLLISDPTEEAGSCSVTLAAGSFLDPLMIPGLAHLLEHTLLRAGGGGGRKGSASSSSISLQDYIAEIGGSINAETTGEQTSFFMEFPTTTTTSSHNSSCNDSLPPMVHVLNMLAATFKNPLFNEATINKEIIAVNNEHLTNKKSTSKIMYHGLRLLAAEHHPFHMFHTGNISTLKDTFTLPAQKTINIKQELLKIYENHYTQPSKMTLVVKGPQSVTYLKKLVHSCFSDIESSSVPLLRSSLNQFNILEESWGSVLNDNSIFEPRSAIFIRSPYINTPVDMIRINFPIYGKMSKSDLLFAKSWCHIYGDETEGSLCSLLKKKDYINSLSTFQSDLAIGLQTLTIQMTLTETGSFNILKILQYVMKFTRDIFYNDNIKNARHLGKFLSEFSAIDKLNFLYSTENIIGMDEVRNYAKFLQSNLSTIGSKWCLRGEPDWDESQGVNESLEAKLCWDAQGKGFVEFIGQHIVEQNMNFVFLASDDDVIETFTGINAPLVYTKDEHYDFRYYKTNFNRLTNNPNITEEPFHMPLPNQFLPNVAKNPSLIINAIDQTANMRTSEYTTKRKDNQDRPIQLSTPIRGIQLWYRAEKGIQFIAKCCITLQILTTLKATMQNIALLEIYTELISTKIQTLLYPSEIINYSWELTPSTQQQYCQLGITISGFTDGIAKIFAVIFDVMNNMDRLQPPEADDLFIKAKDNIRYKIDEINRSDGLTMGIMGVMLLLEPNTIDPTTKLKILKNMQIDEFIDFCKGFKLHNAIKVFCHGDITIQECHELCEDFQHHLSADLDLFKLESSSNDHNASAGVVIEPGSDYYYKVESKTDDDPTNTIVTFIQTCDNSSSRDRGSSDMVMNEFLAYLLSLNLVSELRNRQQLGYAVIGNTMVLSEVSGIHIGIISGDYTPDVLNGMIDRYLYQFCQDIKNETKMTKSQFQTHLKHFIDLKKGGGIGIGTGSGVVDLQNENKTFARSASLDDSNKNYKKHRLLWNKIINSSQYSHPQQTIINFSQKQFINFVMTKISPASRKKISIHLTTRLSGNAKWAIQIKQELKFLLNANDLQMPEAKLDEIINDAAGYSNPSKLVMKKLVKYFIIDQKGSNLKMIKLILSGIAKGISDSLRKSSSSSSSGGSSSTSAAMYDEFSKPIQIHDPLFFKKEHQARCISPE